MTTFSRRIMTGLAVMLSIVLPAGVLLAPTPAAAIPGLVRVTEISESNSSSTKTLTAICPAGTVVLGGGGYAYGAGGRVFVTGLRPYINYLFGFTGYQTIATEDETEPTGNWYVVTYAICAPRPDGYGIGSHISESSSQSWRSAATSCSPGRQVIGAGAVVNGGGSHVGLRMMYPNIALTSVEARAYEDATGYGGSWSVTALVICAYPLPGLERIIKGPTTWDNAATAVCPSPKQVHGVGAYVKGEAFLLGAYPYLSAGAHVVSSFEASATPYAIAICANP